MKRSGWRRPSPALLIACLALFVALGGTVLAASKINGKAIRVRSLPGNRLKVASVPGNRIAPRSLKGKQIKVRTLGKVPSASHADSADNARRAQTATAADHAADANTINGHTVGCTEGRRQFAGACWDLRASAASVTASEAVDACASAGGELPGSLTLMAFRRQPGAQTPAGSEWTNELSPVTNTLYDVVAIKQSGELDVGSPTIPHSFRCVTPLIS